MPSGTSLCESEDDLAPVVDFGAFYKGSIEDRQKVADGIDNALRRAGFVVLTNHGVPQQKVDECFQWSARFFALPEATKDLAPHPPGFSHHRGWSHVGREKTPVMPGEDTKSRPIQVRESFEVGNVTDSVQPNIWLPEGELPGFREFMEGFFKDCAATIHTLLDALSVALRLPETHSPTLSETHSKSLFQLRLLHFPAIAATNLLNGTQSRFGAHTDFGTLTLLFQDDSGGLEIEDPNEKGKFRSVPPCNGGLVVNVGDLMQRWSNGRWKSTVHRVGVPLTAQVTSSALTAAGNGVEDGPAITKPRYSIPFFAMTSMDTVITALPGTYGPGNPKKWDDITAGDYLQRRMAELA